MAIDRKTPEEAIPLIEQAVSLSQTPKEREENMILLALAFSRSGQKDRAIVTLQEVVRINPSNGQARQLFEQFGRNR